MSCGSTKKVIKENTKNEAKAIEVIYKEQEALPKKQITDTIKNEIPDPPKPPKIIERSESIDDYHSEAFNHSSWGKLLEKHVSNQGHVNYKTFKRDRSDLLNYIASLSKNMPNDSWNKEDKFAYWINAYNAMTIDLILRHYPIKSIKVINKPWDQRFWKLEGKWYNLNEIEHNILRKMNEPRIHFGIVCASYSCPKLLNKAFTASNLDKQLTEVTKSFLADYERNTISKNNIQLSKIFQWFAKDFKQEGTLIDFLNKYSAVKIFAKAKKSFKDYNWDLNE